MTGIERSIIKLQGGIRKNRRRALTATILAVILAAAAVLGNRVTSENEQAITQALGQKAYRVEGEEGPEYFAKDYEDPEELREAGREMVRDIVREGIVLLRNENDALPLRKGAAVSVFGNAAVSPVYSSTAEVTGEQSLRDVLTEEKVRVNEKLWDFTQRGGGNSFSKKVEESFEEYSEAAIVVIGRKGSGTDFLEPAVEYTDEEQQNGVVTGAMALQLTEDERTLLSYVSEHFDNIIVVLNTENPMEMGFLDEYGVDGCLWTGALGQNGIKALAEGVETADELRTVIECGIDLIQGFYTGRPSLRPVPAVNEAVRQEILAANLQLTRFNRDTRIYAASDGESLDLLKLAMEHYTAVRIGGGNVRVNGHKAQSVDMLILVADDSEAVLTLKDVNLKGVNETPVQLGARCGLTLCLEGTCTLNKEGVRVPASSRLTLQGSGDLKILNNRNYSVGIGSNYNDPYGTIIVDMEGSLSVQSSGDKVVCVGGGRSAGGGITLLRGDCRLSANGISVIGLGSSTGDAQIRIGQASVRAVIEGNDALGVGSLSANAQIRSSGDLDLTVNSERATGIGSMNGTGDVLLDGGSVSVTVRCDAGACVGSFSGEVSARIDGADIRIHGEGNRVAGFGSVDGACETWIAGGSVEGEILAGEPMLLGNGHSRVIVTGGNVRLYPQGGQTPLSPNGVPLHCEAPSGKHFEAECGDGRSAWTYTAERSPDGRLLVWLPPDRN